MNNVRADVRLPDFFIVGAPKCGTTSLYEWLGGHPLVSAPHKEACFFSQDIFPTSDLPTHISSLEEYCRIFRLRHGERVSGEATPKYLYSDQALADIARLKPDARIILCLRDPTEIAVSLYNQKLREGVEHASSFEEAWAASLSTIGNRDIDLPHERNYYLWACVGERLKRLHEFFHDDSILIILTSELKKDPKGCYLKVLSFLGLPDDGRKDFSVYNERVAIRNLGIHRSLLRLRKIFYPFLDRVIYLRRGRGFGFIRFVNRFNTVKQRYTSPLSDSFQAEMYSLLAEDIRLAETYLNGRHLVDPREI